MGLRQVNLNAPKFDAEKKIIHINEHDSISAVKQNWESIDCCLVTPMYGGGVKSSEPDLSQPVRVSAIRGQLRFWWRLLAQQYQNQKNNEIWKIPENSDLRKQEFALWGGMNEGDEEGKASLVFLRVKMTSQPERKSYFSYWVDQPTRENKREIESELFSTSYVFFAMDRATEQNKTYVIDKGLTWTLEWCVDDKRISDTQRQQVIETLRWWVNFGGVGARTRRGCGAFVVRKSSIADIIQPLTKKDIEKAECQLAVVDARSAMNAWDIAVNKLKNFRQGKNVGRNESSTKFYWVNNKKIKRSGRSRWTEADAIRRITGQYPKKHPPIHKGGNQFPRGMFGMPIIFHFLSKEINADGKKQPINEPKDTTLQPLGKKRMSSPLIIRPIQQNGRWKAAALLLPYKDKLPEVELVGNQVNREAENPNDRGRQIVTLWDETQVQHIKPIKDNGGNDPLQAFMSYFVKPKK